SLFSLLSLHDALPISLDLYFSSNATYPIAASAVALDTVVGLTPTYLNTLPIAPIPADSATCSGAGSCGINNNYCYLGGVNFYTRSEEHTSELQSRENL